MADEVSPENVSERRIFAAAGGVSGMPAVDLPAANLPSAHPASGIDVPASGLVVMGAGNGQSGSWNDGGWTSPLADRTDGPNPASAVLGTASAAEASAQTTKTYTATASGSFNRGTGIVAVWPQAP